jgi:hypothetical protein
MKVGLVMFYDDNIKSFGDINSIINKKYCDKYNITFIVSNEKKYNDRHSAWERLPLLIDNISNFDYLMWIDADAFFYIDSKNVIDIIDNNPNHNFIFSKDILHQNLGFSEPNINSGFFIIKNSEYSKNFLSKWAYDEAFYKNNPHPYWYDQGVLIDMYNKDELNIKQNSIKLEYGVLQHFFEHDKQENTYIYHIAGRSINEKYNISKKYFDKIMNNNE